MNDKRNEDLEAVNFQKELILRQEREHWARIAVQDRIYYGKKCGKLMREICRLDVKKCIETKVHIQENNDASVFSPDLIDANDIESRISAIRSKLEVNNYPLISKKKKEINFLVSSNSKRKKERQP